MAGELKLDEFNVPSKPSHFVFCDFGVDEDDIHPGSWYSAASVLDAADPSSIKPRALFSAFINRVKYLLSLHRNVYAQSTDLWSHSFQKRKEVTLWGRLCAPNLNMQVVLELNTSCEGWGCSRALPCCKPAICEQWSLIRTRLYREGQARAGFHPAWSWWRWKSSEGARKDSPLDCDQ